MKSSTLLFLFSLGLSLCLFFLVADRMSMMTLAAGAVLTSFLLAAKDIWEDRD